MRGYGAHGVNVRAGGGRCVVKCVQGLKASVRYLAAR